MLGEEHKRNFKAQTYEDDEHWDIDRQRSPEDMNRPIQAIVKELLQPPKIPNQTKLTQFELFDFQFTREIVPKMARNLRGLNRNGIFVRDVVAENYRNGTLFDFSSTGTAPHPYLTSHIVEKIMDWNTGPHIDAYQFDELIDLWNEKHPGEEPIVSNFYSYVHLVLFINRLT